MKLYGSDLFFAASLRGTKDGTLVGIRPFLATSLEVSSFSTLVQGVAPRNVR
jgi:hypothetical protein